MKKRSDGRYVKVITDPKTKKRISFYGNSVKEVNQKLLSYERKQTDGKTFAEIESEFAGQGYGAFKPKVGEAVIETLRPIREESLRLMKDKAYLESVYRDGAQKASYVAEKTLRKVYKKVGFVQR